MHTFFSNFLVVLLMLTALLLIVLVLVQRGKGGGLAGAFGGMGGQSAFGTKAGDLFTKITIVVATFWFFLCILMLIVLRQPNSTLSEGLGGAADQKPAANAPLSPGKESAGEKTKAPAAPAVPAKTPAK